jgi:hypothetical protein
MGEKTASDFDQELLNLFDKYVHGFVDRRGSWMARRSSRWAG